MSTTNRTKSLLLSALVAVILIMVGTLFGVWLGDRYPTPPPVPVPSLSSVPSSPRPSTPATTRPTPPPSSPQPSTPTTVAPPTGDPSDAAA